MGLGVGLEVRGQGRVEPAAEADVRRDVRPLQVLHAEGQPHGVGLVLRDVDEEGARVREGAEVLRAAEDDAVRALLRRGGPGVVVAVVHTGAARQLRVAGGRLLDHQALAHVDRAGGEPRPSGRRSAPLPRRGRSRSRGVRPVFFVEVRFGLIATRGAEARPWPFRSEKSWRARASASAPDRLRVGLRRDPRPADEHRLGVGFHEGVQAQRARGRGGGRADRPLAARGPHGGDREPRELTEVSLRLIRRLLRGTGSPATGRAPGTARPPAPRCGSCRCRPTDVALELAPLAVSRRSFFPT